MKKQPAALFRAALIGGILLVPALAPASFNVSRVLHADEAKEEIPTTRGRISKR